jgi:hypothetical protein
MMVTNKIPNKERRCIMAKRHVYNKYEAEMIENFNKTADSLIGIVDNQGSTRLYSHPGSSIR